MHSDFVLRFQNFIYELPHSPISLSSSTPLQILVECYALTYLYIEVINSACSFNLK